MSEKITRQCSIFVLDPDNETHIIPSVPYRYGARWVVTGVERDAEVRKRCRQTTAAGADGTSECPGDSSHERGASAQVTNPGTSSRPKNPSVCGTQVKSCVRGPGSVRRLSHVGLGHRRRCRSFSNGTPGARLASGRPRKRLFTRRSARPGSGKRRQTTGLPCGRDEHGAIRRVCASGCLTCESATPGHCRA